MEFWEILKENYIEIIAAVSTIFSIFITRGKGTAAEREERKLKRQEKKTAKKIATAEKEAEKLKKLKGE